MTDSDQINLQNIDAVTKWFDVSRFTTVGVIVDFAGVEGSLVRAQWSINDTETFIPVDYAASFVVGESSPGMVVSTAGRTMLRLRMFLADTNASNSARVIIEGVA